MKAGALRGGPPFCLKEEFRILNAEFCLTRRDAERVFGDKKRGSGNSGTSCLKPATGLQLYYVLSLPAFWPPGDIKLELITLVERFESLGLNGGMVHENIISGSPTDEAVAFIVVKPLHCSLFFHVFPILSRLLSGLFLNVLYSCSRYHSGFMPKNKKGCSLLRSRSQTLLRLAQKPD